MMSIPTESGEFVSTVVDTAQLDLATPVVLYIDTWAPGGTTAYGEAMARRLRQRGYRVAAICHEAKVLEPLRRQLQDAGVDVYLEEGTPSISGRIQRLRSFASVVRRYRGCVLVLLMGFHRGGGIVAAAGRLAGAQAIIRADLQSPIPPITWRDRALLKAKDKFLDSVVVGSIENVDAFSQQMGRSTKKMRVVHTGIDLGRFKRGAGRDATRQSLGYAPGRIVVGTVSRLSEWRKGIDIFLRMAVQVAGKHPESRFLVVGDGPLKKQLQDQAVQLGIADRVCFTGWRGDTPDLLDAMDIFVMPSLYEGGPTTVLEAMAMGKAVVSTNIGMVPEVMTDGQDGLIVAPGSYEALAGAVERLCMDERFRHKLAARAEEKAHRDFSLEVMIDRYLEVFASALHRRAARGDR